MFFSESVDQTFDAKLTATVTSHVTKYREKNEALRVYNAERLYLPESKRTRLKELGTGYRQQLEGIFEEAIKTGEIRASIDCRFAAHAVIGMCNAWGEFIGRNPDMDLYKIIEDCVDLLINGFREKHQFNRTGMWRNEDLPGGENSHYGLGWMSYVTSQDRWVVGHEGGGASWVVYYPEEDLAVIALSNMSGARADILPYEIARALFQ